MLLNIVTAVVLIELAFVMLFAALGCVLFFCWVIKVIYDWVRGDEQR